MPIPADLKGRRKIESIGRNVQLGFAAIIALLLVSAPVSFYNTHRVYENTGLVAKNQAVQNALSDVLSTMIDVETGQRGYVLTGDRQFLQPYERATPQIQSQIDRLRELLSESPAQHAYVTALEKKIAICVAIAQQTVALRDERGFKEAQEFAASGQGKRSMDDVRNLVAEMQTVELASLRQLEQQSTRSYTVATIADIVAALLGVGLVGLAFEIVRRELVAHRRTLDALHEQREWLRVTLTSIGDAVIVTDAKGVVTFLNPVAGALTGWHQDAVGKPLAAVFQIIDEATRQPSESPMTKVIREGAIVGLANHTLLIARDGREIAIDDSGAPIRSYHGKIDGVVLVFRDISERKRAEEGLRAAGDRFRSVVNHVIHGVISIDENGMIESVNPAAERLFGYEAAEIVGQNIKRLMPEPYHSEHDGYLANYLQTGHAKIIGIGREVVGLRKDGTTFPMELAVSAFPFGKRRLFTGIVQDITARKQMEDELRERVEQLREADHRKNEFLAMLAHELRNPLAPVQNAVYLLRKNCPDDAETQWAHDVIERQVQHMTRMVDDLLDASRITRGMIQLQKETIDTAAVVTRAVEMAQPLIDTCKHRLLISLPPEPLWLEADSHRLAQVLANLLNNAAKYTHEGGTIWLTAERQENDVLFKVRDTGIGIPPEYLPRVFDLFSQEDSSLERTHGGLGIGLTLVRVLVQMHGGAIQAFSAGTGQGSEFVICLPALSDAQIPQKPVVPMAEKSPDAVTPRRILVVDDNVDGARSLSILLRQVGHEVLTAHDGFAALELARTELLDVVLLDIGMPQMSGLEVARRFREELGLKNLLLVAMTGYGQDEDRRRSREAGFNAHMIKPLDLDALQAIIGLAGRVSDGSA